MAKEPRQSAKVKLGASQLNKRVKTESPQAATAHRTDESCIRGALARKATRCTERLETNIHNWMGRLHDAPPVLPTALAPTAPLPAILSAMLPREGDSLHSLTSMTPTLDITVMNAKGTGVVYDEVMLLHASADPGDVERPGRLQRTLDHLEAIGLLKCCQRLPQRSARTKELRLVHSAQHIDLVDQLEVATLLHKPGGKYTLGEDLYANENTSRAARVAAGCAVVAALSVVRGEVRNSFALVRPPGHHAGPNGASGFCFFNNIAVAVRAAQRELSKQRGEDSTTVRPSRDVEGAPGSTTTLAKPRMLVIDWDVHHCDGTQNIFYEDPSVVVISIHQYGSKRGHVLRKTSAVVDNAVGLDELTALLDPVEEVKPELRATNHSASGMENTESPSRRENGRPPVKKEKRSGGDGQHEPRKDANSAAEQVPPSQDKEEEEEEEEDGGGRVPPSRRQRKPVDYNKLAEEIGNKNDELARVFGVDMKELTGFASGSSSSGDESSTSSSGNDTGKKLCEDSEGYSCSEDGGSDEAQPFYPGTGHMHNVGGDTNEKAKGKNINIPWPTHNMGDLEYLQVVLDLVLPVVREFSPEVVFVSCGFDSAAGDLLGSMCVTPSGYYLLVKALAAVCPKLVVVLEGGYTLSNVARCSEAVMRALLESSGSTLELPKTGMLWCQAEEVVRQVRQEHGKYWKCLNFNLFDQR